LGELIRILYEKNDIGKIIHRFLHYESEFDEKATVKLKNISIAVIA